MKFKALVSSDWNECLAPCRPFDPISFVYPELKRDLSGIFAEYTSNEITLIDAARRISALIPGCITVDQMDAYLDARFATYLGVPDFIEWCLSHGILFMINTTGVQGYFQRVFARNLMPSVPIVSANPLIRFPGAAKDPRFLYQVNEIEDKPKNTESIMKFLGVAPRWVVVIGDSGSDGPHFEWASKVGAYVIGSMTKPSLEAYCRDRAIKIDQRFGVSYSYSPDGKKDRDEERRVNFMGLTGLLSEVLDL